MYPVNQRFSINHNGIRYAYGLDIVSGYFLIELNNDSEYGFSRSLVTSRPYSYLEKQVSRGVIMSELEKIGAPQHHIMAIGSDLPFPEKDES